MKAKNLLFGLIAAAGAICIALLLGELFLRLWWRDAPAVFRAQDESISEACQDGPVFCPKKSASAYNTGQILETDAGGLRKGSVPEGEGEPLTVLMVGDSMVFGTGVAQKDSLPAALQRDLRRLYPNRRVWVVNAGVPSYNPAQALQTAKLRARDVKPGLILFTLIHNDLDQWGIAPGGEYPQVRAVLDVHAPGDASAMRIYHALLPHDPNEIRWKIANRSRLYLYLALAARRLSWGGSGSRVQSNPAFTWDSSQIDHVVWNKLEGAFRGFGELAEANGARAAAIIYTDMRMRGLPIRKMRKTLEAAGLDYVDLSPQWGKPGDYERKWTLGWDPHPRPAAHKKAAGLTLRRLIENGLLEKPAGSMDFLPKFDPGLEKQFAGNEETVVAGQIAARREFFQSLASELQPGELTNLKGEASLYGWWEGGPAVPGQGQGQWTGNDVGFLLKRPEGEGRLLISGWTPQGLPLQARVFLNGVAVKPAFQLPQRTFLWEIPTPPPAKDGDKTLEVEIQTPACRPLCEVEPGNDDCRFLCLYLTRLAVKPAAGMR